MSQSRYQVRWPLAHMMDLLEAPDFNEARNVSALFLVREWLKGQGECKCGEVCLMHNAYQAYEVPAIY